MGVNEQLTFSWERNKMKLKVLDREFINKSKWFSDNISFGTVKSESPVTNTKLYFILGNIFIIKNKWHI